jgi:hypothetical protein
LVESTSVESTSVENNAFVSVEERFLDDFGACCRVFIVNIEFG